MRVAHVVLSLAVGGLERVVVNLVRGLRGSRYEPIVVCLEERGAFADELDVPVYALNRKSGLDWPAIRRMRQLLCDVEIVHSHNTSAQLYAALAGVPQHICTRHGRDRPQDRKRVRLNRFLSRFTDVVVAVSDDTRQVILDIERVNPRKVRRIWNGIDTHRYRPAHKPDAKVIGTVTRLTSVDKDPKTMLAAFRQVVETMPEARLQIVGDGPYEAELRDAVAKLGMTGSVDFLGKRFDVPELLQEFDIFTLTSVNEGLSMTLLEAMATGLPIVASDVGGNREIVNPPEGGLLVPARDPKTLAEAYLRLLRDPSLRRQMATAARARAEAHFSVEAMVEQYVGLYDECARKS